VYIGYRIGHLDGDARAFRAVIYNKGAIVLHMLRELLGDEAFFNGLRRFYASQRFTKAGTADLREAMEQASGRPLATFFDGWVFGQDLPVVDVGWTADDRTLRLSIRQQGPAFQVPLPVTLVYADGSRANVTVPVHEARADLELPLEGRLRTIEVNRDDTIPVDVDVRAGT
jgi:aminopeptidase N